GLETLRLFVGPRRVRIAAGQPAPRSIHLVALAPIDDDGRELAPQTFDHPPPPIPLRVTAAARQIEKRVVERISRDPGTFLELCQLFDQIVLQRTGGKRGVFRFRLGERFAMTSRAALHDPRSVLLIWYGGIH